MAVVIIHSLKTIQICKNNAYILSARTVINSKLHNTVVHFVTVKNAGKQIYRTQNTELIKHLIAGNF